MSKHHLRIAVQLLASPITAFYSRYFHLHYICCPFLEAEFQKRQSGVCCAWDKAKMSITVRFSKLQCLRCRRQYLWYFFCQIKTLLTTVCKDPPFSGVWNELGMADISVVHWDKHCCVAGTQHNGYCNWNWEHQSQRGCVCCCQQRKREKLLSKMQEKKRQD